MSTDWMQDMIKNAEYWVKRWHRIFLMNIWIFALNAGISVQWFMDSWSMDKPWYILLGVWQLGMSIAMLWALSKSYRHWQSSKRLLFNMRRVEEADKWIPFTTSPSEAALEQLMAAFEEIKRL